jgi:hypothetical protein
MLLRITLSILLTAAAAAADGPEITFTGEGVTFGGFAPGRKIAWIAITREKSGSHGSVRLSSGIEPVRPNGAAVVSAHDADKKHAIWAAVEIETGAALRRATSRDSVSSEAIAITADPQSTSMLVGSSRAAILWVRPNAGAWNISAYDGGAYDADGLVDGTITVDLQSMWRTHGNPHPPATLSAGDVILVIDPAEMRSASMEVRP